VAAERQPVYGFNHVLGVRQLGSHEDRLRLRSRRLSRIGSPSNSSSDTQTADDGGTVDESFRRRRRSRSWTRFRKVARAGGFQGFQLGVSFAECAVHEGQPVQVPLMHKSFDPIRARAKSGEREECGHLLQGCSSARPFSAGPAGDPRPRERTSSCSHAATPRSQGRRPLGRADHPALDGAPRRASFSANHRGHPGGTARRPSRRRQWSCLRKPQRDASHLRKGGALVPCQLEHSRARSTPTDTRPLPSAESRGGAWPAPVPRSITRRAPSQGRA